MGWTVVIPMGRRPRDGTKTGTDQSEARGGGTVRNGQGRSKEGWKERLRWTQTREKDQARGWW